MASKDDKNKKDDNKGNEDMAKALEGLAKLPELMAKGFEDLQKSIKTGQAQTRTTQTTTTKEPDDKTTTFKEKSIEEVERMTNSEVVQYMTEKSAHEFADMKKTISADRKDNEKGRMAGELKEARKDLPHFKEMEESILQMVNDDPSLKSLSFKRLYDLAKTEHKDTFDALAKDAEDNKDDKGGDDKDKKSNFGGMQSDAAPGSGDGEDKEYDTTKDAAEAAWEDLGMDKAFENAN